tara:strand:- start:2205 stop:3389 length:1185 start_codon:yes stop_codon:yes gene_type:complete
MNVLSLFDGMSCGLEALKRVGIPVNKYFACEIDKSAIFVANRNHPEIIQYGDVTKVKKEHLSEIDLLIGGSPCQGFSFAGKQLNFEDPRSKLFFEFVRLLKETNPKYFLLENVKMKQEFQDIISGYLGVEPIEINSNLVSAQNRKRLYWTNIPGVRQPEDKGIMLKDIVHEFRDEQFDEGRYLVEYGKILGGCKIQPSTTDEVTTINPVFDNGRQTYQQQRVYETKGKFPAISAELGGRFNIVNVSEYVVSFDKTLQILEKEVQRGKVGYFRKDSQANRVYYIHDKAVTLCGEAGGGAAKMGQYLFGCLTPDRSEQRQNGQRFSEGNKFYTLTAQDKHGILIEGYIRKLTPVECERLQTLPDGYTAGVSDTQRYKMLGNGWTVDVIAHIFKGLI